MKRILSFIAAGILLSACQTKGTMVIEQALADNSVWQADPQSLNTNADKPFAKGAIIYFGPYNKFQSYTQCVPANKDTTGNSGAIELYHSGSWAVNDSLLIVKYKLSKSSDAHPNAPKEYTDTFRVVNKSMEGPHHTRLIPAEEFAKRHAEKFWGRGNSLN